MTHDVCLVGLYDDGMNYYLLTKEEFDRITLHQMQDMDFTPFAAWDIFEAVRTPEEVEEIRESVGDDLEGSIEDVFYLADILKLVKLGVINVIESAESVQM